MLESSIKEDWKPVLSDFEHSEAGKKIEQLLAKQKAEGLKIFPPKPYRALELLSAGEVKVVFSDRILITDSIRQTDWRFP